MLQRSPDLTPPSQTSLPSAPGNGANVDRQLYKNLVEMLSLVESLMDRRVNSTYSRRALMVYTTAPSESKKMCLLLVIFGVVLLIVIIVLAA